MEIKEEGRYRIADVQAVSGTILLDQKKCNRVFQKKVQTYMGIASTVTADTEHSACILPGSDMRTGGTLIQYQETDWRFLKRMASQLGLPLVPDTSYYYPRFYLGLSEGEKRESGEIPSCDMCFDGRYYAVSGFITGAIGAKFPGMNHLVEGVVDTTVSAGERLAYAVFDDSMSWDEKWAYAFDPGQMVADFVTGVVIGEFLDGIMAATQNKLRSIFANYDVTMREALETSYGKSTFNSLKNTENFTDSAIEHIFEGQVNARGKAVGYHYEGIEGTSSGGIEMKYRIEEYKLKNGIEDISIIFDEKYQLLTTFMSCDVLPFEKWIKSGFDRVLSGKSEYEEVNGNVCCAEISPKTTKVYDNLAEDAMGNWCEVDTKELRQLIDEWCDKVQKFKMSITTKPPHRQA